MKFYRDKNQAHYIWFLLKFFCSCPSLKNKPKIIIISIIINLVYNTILSFYQAYLSIYIKWNSCINQLNVKYIFVLRMMDRHVLRKLTLSVLEEESECYLRKHAEIIASSMLLRVHLQYNNRLVHQIRTTFYYLSSLPQKLNLL